MASSNEPIRWFKLTGAGDGLAYLRCGPWMFVRDHSGYHRVEYGWPLELVCCCDLYPKDEAPPTPERTKK